MKIITIASTKGGAGKSTIADNLAICALKDDKSVLLIDADLQGSSMLFRSLREADDLKAVSITRPTLHKDVDSFENFDLVIVDAGGRDNALLRSAVLAAAKGIMIIPVQPSQYDIWATEDTFKMLDEARVYADIKAYTMFNQVIARTNISRDAHNALQEITQGTNIGLLETALYNRVEYKNSISDGMGVVEHNPKSKAAEEMNKLYNEIKGLLEV